MNLNPSSRLRKQTAAQASQPMVILRFKSEPVQKPALNLPLHSPCLWGHSSKHSLLKPPGMLVLILAGWSWSLRWHLHLAGSGRPFLTTHISPLYFYNTLSILTLSETILLVLLFAHQESKNLVYFHSHVSIS